MNLTGTTTTLTLLFVLILNLKMIFAKSHKKVSKSQMVTIPRIMHHIYWQWDKSKVVNENRKTKWQACRQTCIDKTPQYEYMLWDDVMIEKLIMEKYHWLMPMYKSYDYEVQRSDVARYSLTSLSLLSNAYAISLNFG